MDCDAIGNSEFTNYYLYEDETTYIKSVFSENPSQDMSSSFIIRVSKFVTENIFNNVILNSTMNATMILSKSNKGLKPNNPFSSGFLLL